MYINGAVYSNSSIRIQPQPVPRIRFQSNLSGVQVVNNGQANMHIRFRSVASAPKRNHQLTHLLDASPEGR